jgi:hypothetical protein
MVCQLVRLPAKSETLTVVHGLDLGFEKDVPFETQNLFMVLVDNLHAVVHNYSVARGLANDSPKGNEGIDHNR